MKTLTLLKKYWMVFVDVLVRIQTKILLGLIYFLVIGD